MTPGIARPAAHSEPPAGDTEKPVMKPVAVVPSDGKVGAGTSTT